MTRDLDLPVRIATVPTVREADGLAMSSRNGRLGHADRERATALHTGLLAAAEALHADPRDPRAAEAAGAAAMRAAGVEPEYLAIVDPDTLEPVQAGAARVLVVVAARVGPARLIDNLPLDLEPVATR